MIYFDLDEINEIADVETAQQYELSPMTHAIVMSLLAHADDRWRWRKSGEKLTNAQWDELDGKISLAAKELMTTL